MTTGTRASITPIFSRNRARFGWTDAAYASADEKSRFQCRCRASSDAAIFRSTNRCAPSIILTDRSPSQVRGAVSGSTCACPAPASNAAQKIVRIMAEGLYRAALFEKAVPFLT
jgi:hypothetical protein